MRLLEVVAIGLVVALAFLITLFARREYFARTHGAAKLYVRLHQRPAGRGWAPGFAQFRGDELRWFRMFSLAPRPRLRLIRRTLAVESRRQPVPEEAPVIPTEWIVLRCVTGQRVIEMAMPRQTVTGFLSWLESVTPYST